MKTVQYALCLGLILSGCTPVLNQKVVHQLSHVSIQYMDGRMGQLLRNRLKNTLKTKHPLYALTIVLSTQDRPLVLNRQGQSAIEHYILRAAYTLCRYKDQCVLGKGNIRVYGVKPMTVSYYSQTVMDEKTQARALESLSEKILHAVAMDLNTAPACTCPILKNPPIYDSYRTPG